jgi:hypothetical protein
VDSASNAFTEAIGIGFTVAGAVAVATAVVVWRSLPRERKPAGAELPAPAAA